MCPSVRNNCEFLSSARTAPNFGASPLGKPNRDESMAISSREYTRAPIKALPEGSVWPDAAADLARALRAAGAAGAAGGGKSGLSFVDGPYLTENVSGSAEDGSLGPIDYNTPDKLAARAAKMRTLEVSAGRSRFAADMPVRSYLDTLKHLSRVPNAGPSGKKAGSASSAGGFLPALEGGSSSDGADGGPDGPDGVGEAAAASAEAKGPTGKEVVHEGSGAADDDGTAQPAAPSEEGVSAAAPAVSTRDEEAAAGPGHMVILAEPNVGEDFFQSREAREAKLKRQARLRRSGKPPRVENSGSRPRTAGLNSGSASAGTLAPLSSSRQRPASRQALSRHEEGGEDVVGVICGRYLTAESDSPPYRKWGGKSNTSQTSRRGRSAGVAGRGRSVSSKGKKAVSSIENRAAWFDRHHIAVGKDNPSRIWQQRDLFSDPQELMDHMRAGHAAVNFFRNMLVTEQEMWAFGKPNT